MQSEEETAEEMSSYESEDNQVVISQVGNEISTLKINTRVYVFRTTSITISSGGGALGYFWVGMCRPGLQIGTLF